MKRNSKKIMIYLYVKYLFSLVYFSAFVILWYASTFLLSLAFVKAGIYLNSLYFIPYKLKIDFAIYSFMFFAVFYFITFKDLYETDYLFLIRDKGLKHLNYYYKIKNKYKGANKK